MQRQVEAYNAHDLDGFLACYAEDVVVEDARGAVTMRGKEELREAFGRLFSEFPAVHVEVPTRIRIGEYVIDEEQISGREQPLHAVVVYHVCDDGIDHMRVIR